MSVGEKSDQKVLHQLFLSDDDLAHLKGQHIHEGAFLLDPVIEFLDVYTFHIILFLLFLQSKQ